MKKVVLACCFSTTIVLSSAQNTPLQKDTVYLPKTNTFSYWNHNETWINKNSMGVNIVNGFRIKNSNFIGIGLGTSIKYIPHYPRLNCYNIGIRYEHDFMTDSKVSPFIYTNVGLEFAFVRPFRIQETNLSQSIGTGVKFHTKSSLTYGLAIELNQTINLNNQNGVNGPVRLMPILKFFIAFGGESKSAKKNKFVKQY